MSDEDVSLSGEIAADLADQFAMPSPEHAHVNRDDVDLGLRRIYLLGEIEEETAGWFAKMLNRINASPIIGAPIEVWINSPGGDVSAEFAIHDLIRSSHAPITTVGFGEISSAATLLLACGHKRYVSESAVVMCHEVRGAMGDLGLRAAKDRRAYEDFLQDHWATLMSRYCRGGKSFWKKAVETGGEMWLLGAEQIIAQGIADEVVR